MRKKEISRLTGNRTGVELWGIGTIAWPVRRDSIKNTKEGIALREGGTREKSARGVRGQRGVCANEAA